MTMTTEQRNHMIGHAAWLAHRASGCDCGMDNPPSAEIECIEAALPYLEERIRAAERERIAAWLRDDEGSHDDINGRAARTFADMIEKGTPS